MPASGDLSTPCGNEVWYQAVPAWVGTMLIMLQKNSKNMLFILMLFCMDIFEQIRLDGKKYLFAAYCVVLLIGAITPFNEIHKGIKRIYS